MPEEPLDEDDPADDELPAPDDEPPPPPPEGRDTAVPLPSLPPDGRDPACEPDEPEGRDCPMAGTALATSAAAVRKLVNVERFIKRLLMPVW